MVFNIPKSNKKAGSILSCFNKQAISEDCKTVSMVYLGATGQTEQSAVEKSLSTSSLSQ